MSWIKITHETPDKPEIIRMAEILKIDQDAVFGKCIRMWIWADQQTISGDDLIVTSSFLDRLTNCSGFSAALLEVRWLKSRNSRFSLPNFDRHNGQTAKNRALSADRMQRQRDAQSVTETALDLELDKIKKKKIENTLNQIGVGGLMPAKADPPTISESRRRMAKAAKIDLLADPAVAFFDEARKSYPGTKNGLITEWGNFSTKYRDEIEIVLPLLPLAIQRETEHKAALKAAGLLVPQWKNLQTWINNRCWEMEFGKVESNGSQNAGGRGQGGFESTAQRTARKLTEHIAKRKAEAGLDRGRDPEILHLAPAGAPGAGDAGSGIGGNARGLEGHPD